MSSLSLIPVVSTWIVPRTGHFDEAANTCVSTTFSSLVVLGMDVLGFMAICFLWWVRAVRDGMGMYFAAVTLTQNTTSVLMPLCVSIP